MRLMIDSLIAVMLVGVVAVLVVINRGEQRTDQAVVQVQKALERLEEQAQYHTAVQSAMAEQDTLLVHLHESWFGDSVPTNVMLDADHPWIDLAPPGDLGQHPPDPIATDSGQAGFWYNPTTGVFRARVKPGANEAETLTLYNRINNTELLAFDEIPDPTRAPIAHELGKIPAKQYASMANLSWSEPVPPANERTEKAFAPIIESQAKAAEEKRIAEENAQEQALLDAQASPDAADPSPDADGTGTQADAPNARPTLHSVQQTAAQEPE